MFIVFVLSLSVLLYIFLGYPIVLGILAVVWGKEVSKKEFYPHVSMIISAYNEENVIRRKLENSLKLDYPMEKLEIIVASESTDETNEIVREYKDKGVVLYAFENREGKRATLYRTVPLAKGEIIVFSDANAIYKKDAIKQLVANYADSRVGCVSGRLKYDNQKGSAVGIGETVYWEYDFFLKLLASRLFALAGCGGVNGSIFAIRKELYNPIDKYRGDDFEISGRVQINGYGVVLEREAISYEEPSESSKQEYNRKVRLASWNLKSALILFSEAVRRRRLLSAFLLFSHRIIRYFTPLWLISLLVSNSFLLNGGLKYVFLVQLLFYSMAFYGLVKERTHRKVNLVFIIPFYLCMANYAALIALSKNLLGKSEMHWEKSR